MRKASLRGEARTSWASVLATAIVTDGDVVGLDGGELATCGRARAEQESDEELHGDRVSPGAQRVVLDRAWETRSGTVQKGG